MTGLAKSTVHALDEARRLLRDADALIVAAGAGLSAEFGLPTFLCDCSFLNNYLPR